MSAPADVRELRKWEARVEEEYREQFGERVRKKCSPRPPRLWRPRRRP